MDLDLNTNQPDPPTDDEGWGWEVQGTTLAWGLLCGLIFNLGVKWYSAWVVEPGGMGNAPTSGLRAFSTRNQMALVVRTDLGMGKGKVAAQCAHAAIMCYKKATQDTPQFVKQWETFGQAKVTLKVDSEAELRQLQDQARAAGLVACVVQDAGRTQIEPGSLTTLGIGPGPKDLVDTVTGHLKLY